MMKTINEPHIKMNERTIFFHKASLKSQMIEVLDTALEDEKNSEHAELLLTSSSLKVLLEIEGKIFLKIIEQDIGKNNSKKRDELKKIINEMIKKLGETRQKEKRNKESIESLKIIVSRIDKFNFTDYKSINRKLKHNTYGELKTDFKNLFNKTRKLAEDFIELYDKFNKKPKTDMLKEYLEFEKLISELIEIEQDSVKMSDEKYEKIIKDWNGYYFSYIQNITVCPYCESQHIFTYYGKSNNKDKEYTGGVRPTLDHYLSKSKHPLLAVSPYNLIPCCSQCNSSLKGDYEIEEEEQINLYTENITNKFKYMVLPESICDEGSKEYSLSNTDILLGYSTQYNIVYRKKDKSIDESDYNRVVNFLDSFHLKNRYSFLKKYINEQIKIRVSHPEIYQEMITNDFKLKPINQDIFEAGNNRFLNKLLNDLLVIEMKRIHKYSHEQSDYKPK